MDYRSAGVDIDLGNRFVQGIVAYGRRTHRPEVISGIGGFAGLCGLPAGYRDPVLVAGTDGVGTKLTIAQALGRHDTIGIDLVAMCVNDVLTVGAEPLFFLDYLATGKLDAQVLTQVVAGITAGCEQAGCALLGGETAEMPGFYPQGVYDVAGFAVGVVERSQILNGSQVAIGDWVWGIPSAGVHSNGFSLVRQIVANAGVGWDYVPPGWLRSLGEELLLPTRIYVAEVLRALRAGVPIHALAHITGGGIPENLPRCLGPGQAVQIEQPWQVPAVFRWLQSQGQVPLAEMLRTFNMGIGFVVIAAPEVPMGEVFADALYLGRVVAGQGSVLNLDCLS
ncbi:MAG: phosphoribosylformylglycinamidine cyclo-ligase [Thermostichales cyanobacterium SZTDM-1c_bins_54]